MQRSGTNLVLNGSPYRFTGVNSYNLNNDGQGELCHYTAQPSGPGLAMDLPGVEVIRAWFFQRLATLNGQPDYRAFDATFAAARARGDKLVVTLTDHWGACESGVTGQKSEAWYTTGYKTSLMPRLSYRAYVQEIVTRYRNEPAILMWQMVNEAEVKNSSGGCADPAVLRAFATDIGNAIKAIDPNHLVSIGTIGSGQCGAQGTQYQTLHAIASVDICEYHDYASGNIPGDSSNGLQTRINQCNALGKPIFVGEAGINRSVGLTTRASQFASKIDAQFAAGVDGFLPWNFSDTRIGYGTDQYDIFPDDPLFQVLASR